MAPSSLANANCKNSLGSATITNNVVPSILPPLPPRPRAMLRSNQVPPHITQAKMQRKNQMVAKRDLVCHICFPVVFILFGAIYLMALCI